MSYIPEGLKSLLRRFPAIAHRYRVWRDSSFERVEPQTTPFGFRLSGHRDMMRGIFEPAETQVVRDLVKKADVFIDVGANIGYYVCHALQANPSCSVIALEPLPSNLRYLLRNIKANGWDARCEVAPVAASSQPAIVSLFGAGTGASLIRGWNGAPDSSAILVPANSLDNIIGERFQGQACLVMIDVEGHEADVIEGAKNLLARVPKPMWFVEIGLGEHLEKGRGNPAYKKVFETFFASGYVAWACSSPPRRITRDELDAVSLGTISLGTHNFLFVEDGVRLA